ncbi:MAG: response regulator transcription factor [Verrucomicrobiia bacterium]
MKTKILIVEDDPSIRLGLEEMLQDDFEIATCDRGDQVIERCEKFKPDLIVLDIMLPGVSGYDICKTLRQRKVSSLILMLTAKSQELDKVIGLDLGADDYVTKPFGVRELQARIHALLRRRQPLSELHDGVFSIGQSTINPKTFQLTRGKIVHPLTPKELKVLQLFFKHPGEVLSRDRLLNEVWGYDYYGTTRTLDQTIVKLRKKLGAALDDNVLESVHGVGYKLNMASIDPSTKIKKAK